MSPDRPFYGGEAPVLATTGEVGGDRHYDGATLDPIVAWNCPSCGVENTGPLEQGCVHCGAGKPGYKVRVPAPTAVSPQTITSGFAAAEVHELFDQWVQALPDVATYDRAAIAVMRKAFLGGYAARGAQEVRSAGVSDATEQLAPAGKTRRTIVAALQLFRDQVLTQSPDEIESGEWCSLAEVDELIQSLEES